jgi:SAM-dependent methyltransferase
VADDPLSRRSLLRLDFKRRPPRPDPEPVKAAIAERWRAGGDSLLRAWAPLAPVLCDAAEVEPGMRVLDAATGDGNVALEALRRGAVVRGVDLAPAQVDRARDRAEAAGLGGSWGFADVEDLPGADGSYDVVLSAYGATLAPRPRRTARELLRVLRPGGLLVLAAPGPYSLFGHVLDLAQDGPAARPRGLPSPAAWGREDVARERILAVAPDTEVEIRDHRLSLVFHSELDAWMAHAGPFGLPESVRDRFADLVTALSDSLSDIRIEEPVTLLLARRGT